MGKTCRAKKQTKYLRPNAIYTGDARRLLPQIEPGTVALSFWSPPYFVGKSYEKDMTFEDWKRLLAEVIWLHARLLVPGGFLAVNIADILCFPDPTMPRIQASTVSRRCGVTRQDVLAVLRKHPDYDRYQVAEVLGCSEQTVDRRLKNNNIRGGKSSTQTKVKPVGGLMEQWAEDVGFFMYDRRIWQKDPAWENSRWHSLSYRAVDEFEYVFVFWKPGITTVDRGRLTRQEWKEWGSRAVWHIRSVRTNDDHEAKFPLELARRVIRLFSAPGDLVCDPFVGSGTTAVAALEEGRRYLGIDLVPKYARLARRNCERAERSEREKLDFTPK